MMIRVSIRHRSLQNPLIARWEILRSCHSSHMTTRYPDRNYLETHREIVQNFHTSHLCVRSENQRSHVCILGLLKPHLRGYGLEIAHQTFFIIELPLSRNLF